MIKIQGQTQKHQGNSILGWIQFQRKTPVQSKIQLQCKTQCRLQVTHYPKTRPKFQSIQPQLTKTLPTTQGINQDNFK